MRIIDAENFDVFYFTIPDGVDADSFGIGIEYVLEEIDKTSKITKKALAPLQALKKEIKAKENKVVSQPKEIRIEDLVREEVENAIASGIVDGTGKNYDIEEEIPFGEEISADEMSEIEKIASSENSPKASAKLKFAQKHTRCKSKC